MKTIIACLLLINIHICLSSAKKGDGRASKSGTSVYTEPIDYEIACGIAHGNESFSERIVGGEKSKPNEFPWMISLQIKVRGEYRHNCGASIIHSQFVLTAGHCVMDIPKEQMRVAAGKYNLQEQETTEQYSGVKKIINSLFDDRNYKNDIALLQLSEELKLNEEAVAPICLPRGNEQFYDKGIVAGWGRMSEDGQLPNELRDVMLPIINTTKCKDIYKKQGYKYFLHDCQICTLDNNNKDSCQGDSGGPLMCLNQDDNKLYVCGLVSWGAGCARKDFPGVFTEVACFTKWIIDEMNINMS